MAKALRAFQSTRPVRGGTRWERLQLLYQRDFNPPAPCGAGRCWCRATHSCLPISIHPPRAGRDWHRKVIPAQTACNFNPPAPCGAGPTVPVALIAAEIISIHPPHAGRDKHFSSAPDPSSGFQSTRPMRGGTKEIVYTAKGFCISIHPPHAGRDPFPLLRQPRRLAISIHPPRAGRDFYT